MKANSILDTIGNTPHVRLSRMYADVQPSGAEVWIKLERACGMLGELKVPSP